MKTAPWIVASQSAGFFLLAGGGKLFTSKEKIAAAEGAMGWVNDFSPGFVRAVGALGVVGAIGLILSGLTSRVVELLGSAA